MVFQGPDYLSIFTKKKSKSYRILNFTFQPEIAQQAGEPMGAKGKVASVIGRSQTRLFLWRPSALQPVALFQAER